MTLSRKKQEAINRVYDMEAKVAEYRGIPDYKFASKDYTKLPIWALDTFVITMREMLNQQL